MLRDSEVKQYRRRDGTVVDSFRRRIRGAKSKPEESSTGSTSEKKVPTKSLIAGASLLGLGALGTAILLPKGISQRWATGIKTSSQNINSLADEILQDISPYLKGEKPIKELQRLSREELIKKGKSSNPFQPLENPEAVKKYNFINSLIKAKDQEDFTFILGGMDGGQGLTGAAIAGNLGIKLPSWGYRRPGLNGSNFFDKNSPNNTHYGHIWTKTQNTITFPREKYSLKIPGTNITVNFPGTPAGIPLNTREQQLDLLNAAFKKTGFFGINPDGQELAAYARVVNKLYPEKKINFVGQCGGGIHTIYAAEVLNELGIKSKVFNIASPNFVPHRLKSDQLMTVISKYDDNRGVGSKADTIIADTWGHGYFGYVPVTDKARGTSWEKNTGYENSLEMQKLYKKFFDSRNSFSRESLLLGTINFARTVGAKDKQPRKTRKNSTGVTEVYHAGRWWTPNKPVPSSKQSKKRMVLASKNVEGSKKYKVVHYGQKGYKHNYSPEAKKSYLARSGGIRNKSGQLTKNDRFSPNYWARKDLWSKQLPADGSTKYSSGILLGLVEFGLASEIASNRETLLGDQSYEKIR